MAKTLKGSGSNGRSRLTKEMIKRLCAHVLRGNTRRLSFAMESIPERTGDSWLRRGRKELKEVQEGTRKEKDITLQAELVVELDKADAELHSKCVANVMESGDPKLIFEFMRRKWNKTYNAGVTSVDDRTGQEERADATEVLVERLKMLMGDDG